MAECDSSTRDLLNIDRPQKGSAMRTLISCDMQKQLDNSALSDHERPQMHGVREAPVTGRRLRDAGIHPEVTISVISPTQETWNELWQFFPNVEPVFDPALYLGGLDDIRQAVYAQPDSVKTILCLGQMGSA